MVTPLSYHGCHLGIMPLSVPAHTRRQFGRFEGTHSLGRCWDPLQIVLSIVVLLCLLELAGSAGVVESEKSVHA